MKRHAPVRYAPPTRPRTTPSPPLLPMPALDYIPRGVLPRSRTQPEKSRVSIHSPRPFAPSEFQSLVDENPKLVELHPQETTALYLPAQPLPLYPIRKSLTKPPTSSPSSTPEPRHRHGSSHLLSSDHLSRVTEPDTTRPQNSRQTKRHSRRARLDVALSKPLSRRPTVSVLVSFLYSPSFSSKRKTNFFLLGQENPP